eukprot:5479712-Alexandrium_andersonii.AAC.1
MSASLVGSEMCIRDSFTSTFVWPWPPSQGIPRSALTSDIPSWAGGPIAVSYTHLTLPTICSV